MEGTEQKAALMSRTKQGEFTWIDITAKDLEAQARFYEGLFGWSHRDVEEPGEPLYRLFMLGDVIVAGASQQSPETQSAGVPSTWNTYIAADDVDGMTHRAEDLGAKVFLRPIDVTKQGRLAGIQDPTGAVVFLWKSTSETRAGRFGQPGSLMWNDLVTRDAKKAEAFYTSLLPSWNAKLMPKTPEPYWVIEADGESQAGIMPMPAQIPAEVPSYWLVYFGVEDAYAATEKAKSLGGAAQVEPMDVGTTVFAILVDPAGAVFGIMTPVKG